MNSMSGEVAFFDFQNETLKYYDAFAQTYFKDTFNRDVAHLYHDFVQFLPQGGLILDAGSGSGRDTKAFREMGFQVEAIDASPELSKISSEYTGIPTKTMLIADVSEKERFDGVWCCASLLHIPANDLPTNLKILTQSLKIGGVIYVSFKYGSGERVSEDGRFYTDMNEDSLGNLIASDPRLHLEKLWKGHGVSNATGTEIWMNAIATRQT